MKEQDYYSILRVNAGASLGEIEAAYRRLARQYDPATSRKAKAAFRMRDIQEAYELLRDPQRRAEYDRLLSAGLTRFDQAPPGIFRADRSWAWAAIAAIAVGLIVVIVLITTLGDGSSEVTAQVAPAAGSPVKSPAASKV